MQNVPHSRLVCWHLRGVICSFIPHVSRKLPTNFFVYLGVKLTEYCVLSPLFPSTFLVFVPESFNLEALLINTTASSEQKGSLVLESGASRRCRQIHSLVARQGCHISRHSAGPSLAPILAHLTAAKRAGTHAFLFLRFLSSLIPGLPMGI